jgi:hypothetical protein
VTVLVVGVVVVLAVAAAVGLRALGVGRADPPVALVGDSITANLEGTAQRRLGRDWALSIDGRPGFLADQQLTTVQNVAAFPFDQVVVNLGTNDAMTSDHDLDETTATLTQMADLLAGVRCAHFVTIGEGMVNDTGDAGARARELNDAIRRLGATRPNVDVIDWAAIERDYEREHSIVITTDTVHPDDVGNRVLADAYGAALAACPN